MQRIICVLAVLAVPTLVAGGGDDARKELKALQGKWKTVAMEAMGKPLPKDGIPDFTFVATADGKAEGKLPGGPMRFTMTVDPKKSPKTIDNAHEAGPHKGMTQRGIYKLEGDRFTVCVPPADSPESDRPKDFNTRNTSNVVFVFERVKDDKKP